MSKMFPKLSSGITFNFAKKNYFDVPSPLEKTHIPSQVEFERKMSMINDLRVSFDSSSYGESNGALKFTHTFSIQIESVLE